MSKSILLALSLILAVPVIAQTASPPPRTVSIKVVGPTVYEDGSAIPAGKPMTFNTYIGACSAVKPRVGVGVGATSTAPNVTPGQCIAAAAVVDTVEGPVLEVVYHGKPGTVTLLLVTE